MAKNNRFPSEANKPIQKTSDKPIAKNGKKEPEQKVVTGIKQDLVKIHYKKKNHHVLSGVHSIRHGDNHIPRSVLNEALKNPSTLQLVNDQDLIIPAEFYKDSEAPKMPGDDGDDDTGDNEPDDIGTTQDTTEGADIEKSEK